MKRRDVLEEQCVEPETSESEDTVMSKNRSEEDNEESCIVKREDTQGSANVEVAPPMNRVARIPEDAGDEKTGEYEEERYPAPAGLNGEAEATEQKIARLSTSAIVQDADNQNGHSTDTVKRWEML